MTYLLLLAVTLYLAPTSVTSFASNNFNPTGEVVTFYPSSLFLSRSPRALAFFTDTKLIHMSVKLKPVSLGDAPKLTVTCPGVDNAYLPKVLDSVFTVQRSIRRLLSLPGYSNNAILICDIFISTQQILHHTWLALEFTNLLFPSTNNGLYKTVIVFPRTNVFG